MFLCMENQAANMCLQLEGVEQRDVIGHTFYTKQGRHAKILACNPRASRFQWTVELEGKKAKCQTHDIDWASGPTPV